MSTDKLTTYISVAIALVFVLALVVAVVVHLINVIIGVFLFACMAFAAGAVLWVLFYALWTSVNLFVRIRRNEEKT